MQTKNFIRSVVLLSFIFCALLKIAAIPQKPSPSGYAAKKNTAALIGPVGMEADSHFRNILTNSKVRVFQLTIEANQSTMLDAHPHDYIVVSLGTNQFEAVGEGNRFALEMNDGEAQVLTGGWPHKLVNKASQPANLLLLEVVRGISPGQSICGLGVQSCNESHFGKTDDGQYVETMLFETGKVRLLRAELGPGGVLPSHTDALDHIVVMLSKARLSNGLSEATETSAGHATWAPGKLGTVKNVGTEDARMLILELK